MSAETKEALVQLRERLGLSERAAETLTHKVTQARLKNMMESVRDAWEEATYTKEALQQVWKERGKDPGDDPSTDGSGGELGIKESVPIDGVRGFKLMEELTEVANFYTGNEVFVADALPENAYPVTVGNAVEQKTKEEMYGIFAWNAVTCQEAVQRDKWERAKPHVGGILGLSLKEQAKVLVRMVSRWSNMFIKNKMQENNGKLLKDDIDILTNWAPQFFGIPKDVTMDLVKVTNKTILQGKLLRLLNQKRITPDDLQNLREEVSTWDLDFKKDLELSPAQSRTLFKAEVQAALEDPDLTTEQKLDAVASSRDDFGLKDEEAVDQLHDLLRERCKGCLVNAVGDMLQGNHEASALEMHRLSLLANFAEKADGIDVGSIAAGVSPEMRKKLVATYAGSAVGGVSEGEAVDVKSLERLLSI